MSSRKRHHSRYKKQKLTTRLLIYASLVVIPAVLGGACGSVHYLLPKRKVFGRSPEDVPTSQESAPPGLTRGALTGAVAGVLLGGLACGAYTWASRPRRRR